MGLVAVIGGAAAALVIFLSGVVVLAYFVSRNRGSDQASSVITVVNESFTTSSGQPVTFKITIPNGAKNSRFVGGFKVTSGTSVNFYVVSEGQFEQWSKGSAKLALVQREQINSTKFAHPSSLVPTI